MATLLARPTDSAADRYREERLDHWNDVARKLGPGSKRPGSYRQRLAEVYRSLVPPGQRVLEVGCGEGGLLAGLEPARGVGVDWAPEMVSRARRLHPHLHFVQADAHEPLDLDETFDFIILSDLVNDLWDVQAVLQQLLQLTEPGTRLLVNTFRPLWTLPLKLLERLGLATPRLQQTALGRADLSHLLRLGGFEVVHSWQEVLWPVPAPLLGPLCNRFLVKFFPFQHLALSQFVSARPAPATTRRADEATVSVIVPARNEAGNITQLLERLPEMGAATEVIFVEGHSTDGTYEVIEQALTDYPERPCRLLRQPGRGKGDAVRVGFEQAQGELLMILDADLSVAPEDLVRFYEAARDGLGEFLNGVRSVYPMAAGAMRPANWVGNRFFSLAVSWLLGCRVRDTLCGTKVLWKKDYDRIAANRAALGNFDPFGDFDLLFGAARLNLQIVDVPIRYRERTYGTTNIQRWKHGWMLLKMVLFAAGRIKFV